MKLKESEHDIQNAIIQYLQIRKYFCIRLNSGAIPTAKGGLVRLAPAGTPDIMAFQKIEDNCTDIYGGTCPHMYYIDLIFIEVKVPKAKATPLQEAKMKELESYGARCLVAHSVAEVQEWL